MTINFCYLKSFLSILNFFVNMPLNFTYLLFADHKGAIIFNAISQHNICSQLIKYWSFTPSKFDFFFSKFACSIQHLIHIPFPLNLKYRKSRWMYIVWVCTNWMEFQQSISIGKWFRSFWTKMIFLLHAFTRDHNVY